MRAKRFDKTHKLRLILSALIVFISIMTFIIAFLSWKDDNGQYHILWRSNNRKYPFGKIKTYRTYEKSNPFIILFEIKSKNLDIIAQGMKITFKSDIVFFNFNTTDIKFIRTNEENWYQLEFLLPVTGIFNASVFYDDEFITNCFHEINNLDNIPANHSTLQCFGKNYEARWCRARNICWRYKRFLFFGCPQAKFNRTIMYPGSRPIPHDYPSCRVIFRLETMPYLYPIPNAKEIVKNRSFLTCRWFGMQHFWHTMFDYTVPLYWTANLNGGVNRSDRIFTIDENTSKKGYMFLEAFSNYPAVNIRTNESGNMTCWNDAIVGFPKTEFEIQEEKWPDALNLPYEFPREAFAGFRDHMISYYAGEDVFKDQCNPDKKHPRIVVQARKSPKRHIVNNEELISAMKRWCPKCNIDVTYSENQTFAEQLTFVCNASMIVSIHGSGLSHMVWMKTDDPKIHSALIEILPYGYDCRDWYKQIANGCGVKYYSWMNNKLANTKSGRKPNKNYKKCLKKEIKCLTDKCHDLLRDQLTTVDLNDFRPTFMKAINYVMNK